MKLRVEAMHHGFFGGVFVKFFVYFLRIFRPNNNHIIVEISNLSLQHVLQCKMSLHANYIKRKIKHISRRFGKVQQTICL